MDKNVSRVNVENTKLIRDVHSKAVLATDLTAYHEFKKRREREQKLLAIEEKLNKILELHGEIS